MRPYFGLMICTCFNRSLIIMRSKTVSSRFSDEAGSKPLPSSDAASSRKALKEIDGFLKVES